MPSLIRTVLALTIACVALLSALSAQAAITDVRSALLPAADAPHGFFVPITRVYDHYVAENGAAAGHHDDDRRT